MYQSFLFSKDFNKIESEKNWDIHFYGGMFKRVESFCTFFDLGDKLYYPIDKVMRTRARGRIRIYQENGRAKSEGNLYFHFSPFASTEQSGLALLFSFSLFPYIFSGKYIERCAPSSPAGNKYRRLDRGLREYRYSGEGVSCRSSWVTRRPRTKDEMENCVDM